MATYASTFATIKDAVIKKLRLDSTLDDTRVGEWVNQVYATAAIDTKFFESSTAGAALAAAATSQTLPAAIIELEFVTAAYGGQTVLMREVAFHRILALRQQVASAGSSGPPWLYSLRKTSVEFWPAALGTEVLTYYGATLPDILTGTAAPAIPEPFASKLLEYGALVYGAEWKKDPLLDEYRQQYAMWKAQFETYMNRAGGALPKAFEVWGVTTPYIPHDPSSDWNLTGYASPWP